MLQAPWPLARNSGGDDANDSWWRRGGRAGWLAGCASSVDPSEDGAVESDAGASAFDASLGPDAAVGLDAAVGVDAASEVDAWWDTVAARTGCMAGCEHLAECGFDACGTLGVDCSAGSAYEACLGACAVAQTCDSILSGDATTYCLDRCEGVVGYIDGGWGTLPDAGPAPDAGDTCVACAQRECPTELSACLAVSACSALAICITSCSDSTCVDACAASHPDGASLIGPLFECADAACEPCASFLPAT